MTTSLAPPTAVQSLLLRAATLPSPQAVEAWEHWRAVAAVDDLDHDSQWLLPLLYVHLRGAGVHGPALHRYANVYRHNWYKNHVRVREVQSVLEALRRRDGVTSVVVGGAALAAAYYPALGARPCGQVRLSEPRPMADVRDVRLSGVALRVPGPVEALLRICSGTDEVDDPSILLWAADAVQVCSQLGDAGWVSAWRCAAERDLVGAMRLRLEWLHAAGLLAGERVAP